MRNKGSSRSVKTQVASEELAGQIANMGDRSWTRSTRWSCLPIGHSLAATSAPVESGASGRPFSDGLRRARRRRASATQVSPTLSAIRTKIGTRCGQELGSAVAQLPDRRIDAPPKTRRLGCSDPSLVRCPHTLAGSTLATGLAVALRNPVNVRGHRTSCQTGGMACMKANPACPVSSDATASTSRRASSIVPSVTCHDSWLSPRNLARANRRYEGASRIAGGQSLCMSSRCGKGRIRRVAGVLFKSP
jgi:hypothetical protein